MLDTHVSIQERERFCCDRAPEGALAAASVGSNTVVLSPWIGRLLVALPISALAVSSFWTGTVTKQSESERYQRQAVAAQLKLQQKEIAIKHFCDQVK